MILAATGHRPGKAFDHSIQTRLALGGLATEYLCHTQPDEVIVGMALGWDQAVAGAAAALGIPFIAAVPFAEQPNRWPAESRRIYDRLLECATSVEIIGRTKVVHRDEPHDVYIGRPSEWGNPFHIGLDGNRAEVIEKYRKYLVHRPEIADKVGRLRGKRLGCWCSPAPCHGDVLAGLADAEPLSQHEVNRLMQLRNEWMVDRATKMVALHDGSWGGTFNCLAYARKKGVPVDNLWDRWTLPADLRELLAI